MSIGSAQSSAHKPVCRPACAIGGQSGSLEVQSSVGVPSAVARLCGAVTTRSPEAACSAIMAALVGNEPVRDDIALLAFRRLPIQSEPKHGTLGMRMPPVISQAIALPEI